MALRTTRRWQDYSGGELHRGAEAASELRARAAYLIALLFRKPEDPELDVCAARINKRVDQETNVNARVMEASTLFNYLNWQPKGDSAGALVARIEPLLAQPDVTPLMQVW